MKKKFRQEYLGWFFTAVVLPIVAPFIIAPLFMFFAAFVGQVDATLDTTFVRNLAKKLLDEGIYAFLGLAVLLSLFQDYKIAINVIKGVLALAWFVLFTILGFLFVDSLGLITSDAAFSVSVKRSLFILFSTFSITFALILKISIIKNKIKQLYKL